MEQLIEVVYIGPSSGSFVGKSKNNAEKVGGSKRCSGSSRDQSKELDLDNDSDSCSYCNDFDNDNFGIDSDEVENGGVGVEGVFFLSILLLTLLSGFDCLVLTIAMIFF